MNEQELRHRYSNALRNQGKSEAQIDEWIAQELRKYESVAPGIRANQAVQAPKNASNKHTLVAPGGRANHAAQASAPYRFVPYNPDAVVLAEPEALAPLNQPKPAGLCARITLEWTAETPLLIGEQEGQQPVVRPLSFGSENYVIPGSTLRGAIRSIAEIAGAARLSQVNKHRIFGLRDFTHKAYAKKEGGVSGREGVSPEGSVAFAVSRADQVKAGWLQLAPNRSLPHGVASERVLANAADINDIFIVQPASNWHTIEADVIGANFSLDFSTLPSGKAPRDGKDFTMLGMDAKYASLGQWQRGAMDPTKGPPKRFARSLSNRRGPGQTDDRAVVPDSTGEIEGYLAFSGRSPSGKRLEYVVEAPSAEAVPLKPQTMLRFRQLNSRAVDEALEPEGNWQLVLQAFQKNRAVKIPVFYVGSLDDQGKDFFMGLTRLFKVPHRWKFETVLENSGVRGPARVNDDRAVDQRDLDMVDALFGYVYEPPEGQRAAPADNARKSRVAFSAAHLVPGCQAEATSPISTAMMGPKPSFAPFYLAPDKDGVRDYSADEKPKIAGRKRYPARTAPPAEPRGELAAIEGRLKEQVTRITEMQRGRAPSSKILSHLSFLVPKQGQSLRFFSEVRLFNVTEAELGLVLWALTFGGREKSHRHMLGRAKGFGAGQMQVAITGLNIEPNGPADRADFPHGENITEMAGHFRGKLERHMSSRPEALEHRQTAIAALLATADPKLGAKWGADGKLDTMIVSQRVDGRTVQHFQRLRDMVKPHTDGSRALGAIELLPLK